MYDSELKHFILPLDKHSLKRYSVRKVIILASGE